MRDFIRFLLVGFAAGWIAAILVRGRMRFRGCLTYVVAGIAGAIAGGYLFDLLDVSPVLSVVAATAGAVAVLVILTIVRNA